MNRMKRVYYLGGLNIPPGAEKTNWITSGQQSYAAPPVGEFLEVEEWIAKDLINKYGSDVFNYNQQLAQQVAAGKVKFSKKEIEGKMVVTEVLSDEEILARADEIRSKKKSQVVPDENSESEGDESDDDPEDSEKRTTRRRKKVEE